MELRNLRTLVRIAELGSFSAAAEDLGYTQSTVTMQIKALEEELGAPLFDRIGRRIRLTDSGRQAVQSARVMLAESERLLRSVQSEENALVRVGVYESLCGGFLPGTIRRFSESQPGAVLSVVTAPRTELERRLQADQVDLIWVYGTTRRSIPGCWRSFPTPHSRCVPLVRPLRDGRSPRQSCWGRRLSTPNRAAPTGGCWNAFWRTRSCHPKCFWKRAAPMWCCGL